MVIDKLTNAINFVMWDYWEQVGDPRTKHLFPMSNGPWKVIAFISCYLLFVTKIGPKLMADRKPFALTKILLVYNTLVVIINGYFFYIACYYLDYGRDLFNFKFMDRNNPDFYSENELAKVWMAYLYSWTKVLDLFDTVFFVLRKKSSQVTGNFN